MSTRFDSAWIVWQRHAGSADACYIGQVMEGTAVVDCVRGYGMELACVGRCCKQRKGGICQAIKRIEL